MPNCPLRSQDLIPKLRVTAVIHRKPVRTGRVTSYRRAPKKVLHPKHTSHIDFGLRCVKNLTDHPRVTPQNFRIRLAARTQGDPKGSETPFGYRDLAIRSHNQLSTAKLMSSVVANAGPRRWPTKVVESQGTPEHLKRILHVTARCRSACPRTR